MRHLAFASLILLTACGGNGAAPEQRAEGSGPDGDLRLDRAVVPIRYALDLTIDPAKPRFSGEVVIDVEIAAPTAEVRMHGKDLAVSTAEATSGGSTRAGTAVPGPNGGLALRFAEPLPAGPATLRVVYDAPLPEVPNGLYRVEDEGHWYAFTQFEPLYGRQAFPSFDQPEFKTPYRTTLRVPKGQLGLTNGPETARRDEGEHTVYTFAETKPLPTYLVAFAVGPFDVVEAPADAIPGTPLRIIATKGKGRLAKYALARTPLIHAALSEYFGRPHPFAKLDMVAVPNFAAGAMENVGLVTYRETLLLLDEDTAPAHRRMWSQSVIAHELAHMWFGNLVTMAWWDDLWLNEAFATWMAAKIVAQVDPQLEIDLEQVEGTRWTMRLDAQKHARAIRQPIVHGGDIQNAFDGITYGKGARVLRMVEAWLGEEAFRQGVRDYLDERPYGTATTADLLGALSRASGKDVEAVIGRFLDQPGTPLVDVELTCGTPPEAPEPRPTTITLKQTRYLPAGSDAPAGEPWRVPVCIRYAVVGGEPQRACFELDGSERTFDLDTPGCPAWLHPNADQNGYYQWRLAPEPLLALAGDRRAQLSPAERVALPGVFASLLEAGAVDVATFLEGMSRLAAERHRIVVEGVIGGLSTLFPVALEDDLRAPFAGLVRDLLGHHAERLGFEPRPGEPVEARLQRPGVMNAVAYMGQDTGLRGQAGALAGRFLKDPASVSPEVLPQALPMAAWSGDEALWTGLRDALKAPQDPVTREAIIRGLASFEDPALITRSLGLLLDGTLRAQDFRTLARGISDPAARDAAWKWLTGNYGRVVEVLGETAAPRLPFVGGGFCDAARRAEVEAFFAQPAHAPEGTERNLGLVLEDIDRCIRLREATREPLKAWLGQRGKQ